MTNRYLLEVGTEELPASYSKLAIEQFKNAFEKLLNENSYKDFEVNVYTTPRRITTIIDNIIENESIEKEEIKGPSKAICFDEDGNPSKALQGFLKSKGLSLDDIFYKELGGTEYVFASVEHKSLSFTELIEANVESIIRKIVFPKSMKWGGRDLRFARPIRWIVSLYNDKVVKFNLEDIRVSNLTNGHRFLSRKDIEIPDAHDYMKIMEDSFVIVDNSERKARIRLESERLAKSVGGSTQNDEAIIDQVNNLVEYPTPLLGTIKDQYLELPDEVVITPMKDHLRYFPVVDSKNRLMNHFITVRNGDDKYIDIVRKGNEKVLAARLEEVRDGILNHSGQNEAFTLEGKLVKFADRIAYINHDIDDAIRAGILAEKDIPKDLIEILGDSHSKRINTLITDILKESYGQNHIAMSNEIGEAMEALRAFMFKEVYFSPLTTKEHNKAKNLISMLYDYYEEHPDKLPDNIKEIQASVNQQICDYIAGMSDIYAINEFNKIYVPQTWKSEVIK